MIDLMRFEYVYDKINIRGVVKMKKNVLFILLLLFININSFALAKTDSDDLSVSINKISSDKNIIEAVKLMKDSPANESYDIILGNNPTHKIIKIKFRDLSELGMQYKNFDALGWLRREQLYIYINQKHKNAPPEALCALISARALNQDKYDSINEEVYIWTLEAVEWNYFLEKDPSLANSGNFLIDRENDINKLYKKSMKDARYIEKTVKANRGYTNLKMQSPGFEDAEFKFKMDKLLKN